MPLALSQKIGLSFNIDVVITKHQLNEAKSAIPLLLASM